uniref:Uncharacterized protein n=5 Tax=Avena sativa TaxID=4498 RepID=A0ACD5TB27_AVESA
MSDEGGVTAAAAAAAAAPLDNDDLFEEILLRFSPLPSSLPRASVVSKRWKGFATAPSFHRRFLAHHRNPPILGVFEKLGGKLVFTSVLDPPDRIPRGRFTLRVGDEFNPWNLLGCRHGHVPILIQRFPLMILFDPISADCRVVAIPPGFNPRPSFAPDFGMDECIVSGAVLCGAGHREGHVHGDCHMSPFKVAVVGTFCGGQHPAIASLYSSETGIWEDRVSTAEPCAGIVSCLASTLVGNVLYWWLDECEDGILEFDLDMQTLAVVERPTFAGIRSSCLRIIRAEGGGVGIAVLSYPSFQMWGRKVSSDGVATWILQKTVNMHEIIGLPSGIETRDEAIVGYSEEADALFISVSSNSEHYSFIVQLESMQSRRLNRTLLANSYHPFANFYTPGTAEE